MTRSEKLGLNVNFKIVVAALNLACIRSMSTKFKFLPGIRWDANRLLGQAFRSLLRLEVT